MEKFYTTTAIDYVNGAPHIGHAYEKILTDVIYRHFTQRCDNTYFLTGTDEHGIKIQKTSAQNGVSPRSSKMRGKHLMLSIRSLSEQQMNSTKKLYKKYLKNSLKKATSISTLTKDYIVPAAKLS